MFTNPTQAKLSNRPARPAWSLFTWLLRLDARYRQAQKFKRLTEAERRDMGLPIEDARPAVRLPTLW